MRFASKVWLLTVATVASGPISLVEGFQLSSTPSRGFSGIMSSTSSIRTSAATARNEVSTSSTHFAVTTTATTSAAPRHDNMTYAEVNQLTFRALQRECKALGLSAVGTTAALRGRLLEHFGLMGKESFEVGPEAAVPMVTVAEVEVSFTSLLGSICCV